MSGADDASPASRLQVVRGYPDDVEVAALVVALATRPTAAEEPAAPSRWAARAPGLRAPLSPGRDAWRLSGW